MKKVVFFTDENKIGEAFDNFNLKGFANKKIPFKLHMGEKDNKYFPKTETVKKVVMTLKERKIKPFLFDTTVMYQGQRHTKKGYYELLEIHGFSKKNIGCDVVIDDKGIPVKIEGRDYEVAEHLYKSSHIFAFSHVKGHIQTGFGGAIKNFGMGGVTKETKRKMHHGSRPMFQKDKCTYCGVCTEVCPFNAITINENTWNQNMNKCFGCGVCIENCKNQGLNHKDADIQFVLACAAKACLQDKNVIYFNDVNRIARFCDCDPEAGPVICPDIGYLVSDDPVAIDKASLDLIYDIKPGVFEKVNKVDPLKQIKFGEEIGLGSSSYQFIEL
jgi:uncharacterized Fe-S center protein